MNRLTLFLLVLIGSGCVNNEKHYEVYRDYFIKYNSHLNYLVENMQVTVDKGGSRPKDVEVVNKSRIIAKFREDYLSDRKLNTLLKYADNIITLYGNLEDHSINLISDIKQERQQDLKDSLSRLSLLLKTIKVEEELQRHLAMKVGSCNWFSKVAETEVNERYKSGDTVYIIVKLFPNMDFPKLNLDSVSVKNISSGNSLSFKALKSGHNVILSTIANETGEYKLDGLIFDEEHKDFRYALYVKDQFLVE